MRKHSTISKINYFLIVLFSSFFCTPGYELKAQLSYKVLFLGNSYTSFNNLPQLVHDVALSAGDTLVFDSNSPGGFTLEAHSNNVTTQNKIIAGGWDYVVIQGQSQEPVMSSTQFSTGASALYSMIRQYNTCAVVMPYMTWGRKNGDASNCPDFPLMCTYEGMDSTIRNRYLSLTSSINGEVSPVSVVWKYLRQNYPNIELYQSDESHPTVAGSYAAACCFYTAIFKKDPALITFNSGLTQTDASIIRSAAKTEVFDNLQLWDFKKLPIAKIAYETGAGINEVIFHAGSYGVKQTYLWDFGDGDTSSAPYSPHSYLTEGTYTVSLTTTNCDLQGLHTRFTDTIIQLCSHTPTVYTTHPWLCEHDTLWTQAADSYQWFGNGVLLPNTNQYLVNYYQYNVGSVSVVAAANGCAELSETYSENPEWSGYYFSAMGSPCNGDTVTFNVLSSNGPLTGLETILWFKNDFLLPSMTNEDTLFISTEGKYECKVIDLNATCPLDTTSYVHEYDCEVLGIDERDQELFWTVFPNPASESIIIQFGNYPVKEPIQIYNAIGCLTKSVTALAPTAEINIADLPDGLYYIRMKNSLQPSLKFIKL